MSNPVIGFQGSILEPPDPTTIRKTYTLKVFDAINFFLYNDGESSASFVPDDMGVEFYLWYRISGAVGPQGLTTKPAFVTDGSWESMKAAPSGFVTPNNSIMPKLIGPSTLMVDNGVQSPGNVYEAYWWDSSDPTGTGGDLFNWELDRFNTIPITGSNWYKYVTIGSHFSAQYISITGKDDCRGKNVMEMHMVSPATPPEGDWDSSKLVVGGAFTLMLNILGITPGKAGPQGSEGVDLNRWKVTISFGDVTMVIGDASTMNVNIAGTQGGGCDTLVNLAEGLAKEGPPQQGFISDKPPLLITVYPVWNGIVVSTGQQESRQVVQTAATYCRKLKDASIQVPPYVTSWFGPQSPSNIEVGTDSGAVIVDFGDRIDIVAENCRFEVAYLPRWFVKAMAVDGWHLLATDTAESTYTYNIYTIYTKNDDSDWVIATPTAINSGIQGSEPGSSYFYIPWTMWTTSMKHKRYAGEIFAYVLETKERRTTSIKNGNGSFSLTWTGGTAGDPDIGTDDWKKYVKSLSVTIGTDGSSGTMVVDKYGVAGQEAVANQSIGAICLSASGGISTKPGDIFKGLGMGVSNADSTGDATWTIPLVGLEKKLDDIALINPPFMDGETLSAACEYLCRYAGIIHNMAAADPTVVLSATEDINTARFDWKSGTSVKTALDEVMADTGHTYVVRDGEIFFYKLGVNGLPITLGPDRSAGYDSTNIVSINKQPDFENLRNYVIGMAIKRIPEGQGTLIQQVPTWPILETRTKATTPDVPWARCYVKVYSGMLDQATLSDMVDKEDSISSVYDLMGSLTIPGNAEIKPFDKWGSDLVITSVTHNIDLESKTWTTDLAFQRTSV